MTTPRWYSQPFPATGSISAEGIKKTLGKPPMPWLAILAREAAQNSWDARLGDEPVRFRVNLDFVQPQHLNAWQNALLNGAPPADRFSLRGSLRGSAGSSPAIRTLTVSDRGTKGLGGPTRADAPRGTDPRDWVSFVLNVGDPPDTKNGGGTYGYGKGVLFQMSRAGTVIVHTRTRTDEGLVTRLIAVGLGESYELPNAAGSMIPYTGRHWWGHVGDEHVEPLVDREAVAAATSLGLPRFTDDESGTDLVIVDPDFGVESDEDAARYLADSLAWNLWPIMLERRGPKRLTAEVRCMGQSVPVPVPEKTRGLKIFVAAYERMSNATDIRVLKCGNPRKDLGKLALERQLIKDFVPPAAAQDLGITGTPHHVCLLRSPELVVKYHAGPLPISTDIAYAGVFRCQDDLDRIYAAAEPPTHDDWVPMQLQGADRTFVRMTFTRLKEELTAYVKPADSSTNGVRAPLGGISNYLGSLIAAASGTGSAVLPSPGRAATVVGPAVAHSDTETSASHNSPRRDGAATETVASDGIEGFASGGTGSSATADASEPFLRGEPRTAGARLRGEPYFLQDEGEFRLAQDVLISGEGPLSIRGAATIAMADGNTESRPPALAEQPLVIGWRNDSGLVAGALIEFESARAGTVLTLLVSPAPDSVTQISITVKRRSGAVDGE